jgi:hypothetical protein
MRAGIIFIEYKGRNHREGEPPPHQNIWNFLEYSGPDNFAE